MKAILRIAFDKRRTSSEINRDTSVDEGDSRSTSSKANSVPQRIGATSGASGPIDDALDRLTRALGQATDAGQWKVAEAIIRQIERIELARAGNVVRLEERRAKR